LGRLSDFYGRKPMIVCGLLGTVSATLVFGFSTSFTQALLARTGAGLLNGNVGVIRTMVAEMVVERAHQAKAFSVMPVVWSLGSILGPILGGAYSPQLHKLIPVWQIQQDSIHKPLAPRNSSLNSLMHYPTSSLRDFSSFPQFLDSYSCKKRSIPKKIK
jgi:MFS family permease